MNVEIITKKEKRNKPVSVRLPVSTVNKLKTISNYYERSQSEIIEALVNNYWLEIPSNKNLSKAQKNDKTK